MKFTYINYGDNILRKLKADEKTIVVFSDYFLKNYYLRNREKNILIPEGKFFTLDEFQKKIFITEKIILTEAKRPLTLYRVLKKEHKDMLNIQNYYDIIDFADLFFKYYRELSLNMTENIEGLQEWQKEYIKKFDILKEEYDVFLKKNDFIPSDWTEHIENYSEEFIKDYNKIIFADIPCFTPLMKEILKKLDRIADVEIILQMPREDYNEEKLEIEKVSLSKNEIKCRVFENSGEMSEIINLIWILKNDEKNIKEIFSSVPDKNRYAQLFPKYFASQKMKILDDTKLYKFMKIQNSLVLSLESKKRNSIPTENFAEALDCEIFKYIYNINKTAEKKFRQIFSAEYKYIDEKLFKEMILNDMEIKKIAEESEEGENYFDDISEIFGRIYKDILEIKSYKTVDEFVEYIKKIGFEKFRESEYLDVVEKFYQAVDNIKTSEKLCGAGGFRELFRENTGTDLYTLLIKYMEGIEIREVEKDEAKLLGIVKNISDSRIKSGGKSYFVDTDSTSLPGNLKDDMIFTESQRGANGFTTFEEKKLIAKYRFVQGIFNCGESVIFTQNIENEGVGKSVFLDELMLRYNIKIEKNPLSKDEIFEIIKNSLTNSEDKIFDFDKLKNIEEYFSLKKESRDFEDNKLVLGTYDVINLRECGYRFFLERNGELSGDEKEDYGTSMRFLGITAHKIFDEVSKKVYMNIKKHSDYRLDEAETNRIIEKILAENSMKIPVYMDLYFREVLFPKIKSNLFKFYREIEKELSGKKVNIFWGEKSDSDKIPFFEGDTDIFIKGRADLVVETEDGGKYIVDYKTGGKKAEQLDIYSIIMYGDENAALKRIYNVIQGNYEKIDKSAVSKIELEEFFRDFAGKKYYERAEKKGSCVYCPYIQICRREVV